MKRFTGLLLAGTLAVVSLSVVPTRHAAAQDRIPGQVTEDQLGQMIQAIGLKPEKKEQRYDFAFRATMDDQEWELSMSAVLSQDGSALWVMAWLDPLPKSSNDVPRTALLRMLAQNDQLGNGKFFAYIPSNRRFVLQRTVSNANLTSGQLRIILQDLGSSVVETYPVWAVANWSPTGTPTAPIGQTSPQPGAPATRSATNDSKFQQPIRR